MRNLGNFSVRADYYDNGCVVPISVTMNNHSHYISHIISSSIVDGKTFITCESGEDMRFWFCFSEGKWKVQIMDIDD